MEDVHWLGYMGVRGGTWGYVFAGCEGYLGDGGYVGMVSGPWWGGGYVGGSGPWGGGGVGVRGGYLGAG